jgi:hypothetical protein
MHNRAWDMLREQFKPDAKGRFKTLDAMSIAKQLAEEVEKLQNDLDLIYDYDSNLIDYLREKKGIER